MTTSSQARAWALISLFSFWVGAQPAEAQDPPSASDEQQTEPARSSNWQTEIIPSRETARKIDPVEYQRIYQSIPFRRAEYLANPSYRHDATMEILFQKLRPTVIHRQDRPQRVVNPRPSLVQPYRMSMPEYWQLLNNARPALGAMYPFLPGSLLLTR